MNNSVHLISIPSALTGKVETWISVKDIGIYVVSDPDKICKVIKERKV